MIYHPYDSDIIPIFYSDILTISLVNNIFQYIPLDITLLDNRTNIPNITIVYSDNIPIYQWEISRIQFMEVRKRTIFLAIYCGDIPWNLALKNRPKIYGIGTSNQSIPSRCGAFVFFLIAYPLRKSSISWTTVVPWTCWTSRLPRKNYGCEWMVSRDI